MPPFTGSDVPLEEDILKRPIEFVKTWVEFAADTFEQVNEEVNTVSSVAIFTVPDNKTFFMTGASISTDTDDSEITSTKFGERSLLHSKVGNVSQDFTMPFKFDSGIVINAVKAGIAAANFIIRGFLIDKKIS